MDLAKNPAMAPKTSAFHGANLAETLMGRAGTAIKSGVLSVLHALDDGTSGRCVLVNGQKISPHPGVPFGCAGYSFCTVEPPEADPASWATREYRRRVWRISRALQLHTVHAIQM